MGLNDQIETSLDTLEALYYFTQGLEGKAGEHIREVRQMYQIIPRTGRRELLDSLKADVELIRDHYGALAPNKFYRDVVAEARKAKSGLAYISKLRMDREIFSHYEKSLPRWPHMKSHAFVVFDPQLGQLNQMFEMDGQLFHDAQFLLQKARVVQAGAKAQRDLPPVRHRVLHTLL